MNGWKVCAIIFVVLFILETIGVIWIASIGLKAMSRETECKINACDGYDAFVFDSVDNVCYCYLNNEIAKQEYIK